MIQWIITIIILLLALAWAGKHLYRFLFKKKTKKDDACAGCSSDCSTCPFFDQATFENMTKEEHQSPDINKTLKSE